MLVSFVLRLRPDQLTFGELVGEVEDVESGARHAVTGTADLVTFCRRMTAVAGGDPAQPDGPRRPGPGAPPAR